MVFVKNIIKQLNETSLKHPATIIADYNIVVSLKRRMFSFVVAYCNETESLFIPKTAWNGTRLVLFDPNYKGTEKIASYCDQALLFSVQSSKELINSSSELSSKTLRTEVSFIAQRCGTMDWRTGINPK